MIMPTKKNASVDVAGIMDDIIGKPKQENPESSQSQPQVFAGAKPNKVQEGPQMVKRGFVVTAELALDFKIYQATHPALTMSEHVEAALREYMEKHP